MNLIPGAAEPRFRPLYGGVQKWAGALRSEIKPERLLSQVRRFPAPRNRLHSPESMQQADELILHEFKEAGWPAACRPFAFTNAAGYLDYSDSASDFMPPVVYPRLEGVNIVATKEGDESQDALVVVAHHDTIRDTPGANDNTASVASLLELARVLWPYRFRCTIILAATDMEELNLFGAKALVSELLQERRVLGAVNYETMAYTSPEPGSQSIPPGLGLVYPGQVKRMRERLWKGDFTVAIYNGAAAQLAAWFASGLAYFAGPHTPLLLRDPLDLPVTGKLLSRTFPAARNFARGDHVPFWRAGLPAIQITDTANFRYRHYHQPTDTPEKLDYARLAAIVGATAVAISQAAGLIEES